MLILCKFDLLNDIWKNKLNFMKYVIIYIGLYLINLY